MQRKGGGDASRLEEGREIANPPASQSYPDDDQWRKQRPPPPQRQGWSPTIVLLVGALLVSVCFSAYLFSEIKERKLALHGLAASLQAKSTEFAQKMAASKHYQEELELGKRKAEEAVRAIQKEMQRLLEELTNVKHSLHEEQNKGIRMHRDNTELHKKLKTKSNELKVLEEQTHAFEVEMSQLTKSIHGLQGEVQHDVAGTTDYQVLYKKQEEQQQRFRDKMQQGSSGSGGGGEKASSGAAATSNLSHHTTHSHRAGGSTGGIRGKQGVSRGSAAVTTADRVAVEGHGLVDDEHEYRDHEPEVDAGNVKGLDSD